MFLAKKALGETRWWKTSWSAKGEYGVACFAVIVAGWDQQRDTLCLLPASGTSESLNDREEALSSRRALCCPPQGPATRRLPIGSRSKVCSLTSFCFGGHYLALWARSGLLCLDGVRASQVCLRMDLGSTSSFVALILVLLVNRAATSALPGQSELHVP